jgi:hypothetical protein
MNAVMHDKCWARRFARTPGDAGIVRTGKRYRMPIDIWKPVVVPSNQRRWNITVPKSRPPVRDCPQGEKPWKPLVIVPQDPHPFPTRSPDAPGKEQA